MDQDEFFEAAKDGAPIDIDLDRNIVVVGGREYTFQMSKMEKSLSDLGGITRAFMKLGQQLFEVLCSSARGATSKRRTEATATSPERGSSLLEPLQW
jgi:type IV secretory pathway VirB9-like protein